MRPAALTVALLALVMSLACADPAKQAKLARARAFEIPREGPLPPLAVADLIVRRDAGGDALPDTPIAVILTRPVDRATATAAMIRLVDQDQKQLPGATRWRDPQLAIFLPASPLPPGKALRLQLLTPLRTVDGSETLSPCDLATFTSRPLRAVAAGPEDKTFYPVSSIHVRFERTMSREDLLAHAVLTVSRDPTPIPFDVAGRTDGGLLLTPKRPIPPGETVHLAWREGARALTSVGLVELAPFEQPVAAGLRILRIGDDARERCVLKSASSASARLFNCDDRTGMVHLSLSAPISATEVAAHVHVGKSSTARLVDTASGSDHRLIVGGYAPTEPIAGEGVFNSSLIIRVTLDAELTDVFGQRLGARHVLLLRRWFD